METQSAAATPVQQDPAHRTAAASRARLKHGMYSRQIVLPGEDRAEYESLRADLLDDLRPDGETESRVVEHLVHAQWKLQRLWANETGVHVMHEEAFPQGDAPLPLRLAACGQWDAAGSRELERISRHQQRVFNQFYKALRELAVVRAQRPKGLLGEKPAAGKKPATDSKHAGSGVNLDRGAGTADPGSANCRADRDPLLQNYTASPGTAQVGASAAGLPDAPTAPCDAPSPAEPQPHTATTASLGTGTVESAESEALHESGAILVEAVLAAWADPAALSQAAEPPPGLTAFDRDRWWAARRNPKRERPRLIAQFKDRLAFLRAQPEQEGRVHRQELAALLRCVGGLPETPAALEQREAPGAREQRQKHQRPPGLDPNRLTPYQAEIEALEAEDDRIRARMDSLSADG
jgi:hypothetical protein